MNEIDLLTYLKNNGVEYLYFPHPAVMTAAQAAIFMADAPGVSGKNLFLRDKKGRRYVLLMTIGEKRVDLKQWSVQESLGKLSFADSQALTEYLDVCSGAVGPLALINDLQRKIEVYIDCELWKYGAIQCHPLVNTASLVLTTVAMEKFFALTGHSFRLVDVPSVL